jgi:hypothetical protein
LEAIDSSLLNREAVLQKLRSKLLKAQASMKHYADKGHRPHPFVVGDSVFVKLRPYRQVSVGGSRSQKLAQKFYGPFKILEAIGDVAFKLELPTGSRIHPVFHVSKLKPCYGDHAAPTLALPLESVDNQPQIFPLVVLDIKQHEDPLQVKVMVQWHRLYPEDMTWEFLHQLQAEFPSFHLEDKVVLEAEGDVINQIDDDDDELEADNYEDKPLSITKSQHKRSKPK